MRKFVASCHAKEDFWLYWTEELEIGSGESTEKAFCSVNTKKRIQRRHFRFEQSKMEDEQREATKMRKNWKMIPAYAIRKRGWAVFKRALNKI
jgi:hypothetical protein